MFRWLASFFRSNPNDNFIPDYQLQDCRRKSYAEALDHQDRYIRRLNRQG